MTNQVVTYYEEIPGLWSNESQLALIELWRESWTKAGWVCTVLKEADVKTHSRFDFFFEHFNSKPSEYGNAYTNACWLRWLAAAHYGNLRGFDVMLTDYDVLNVGFEPREIYPNEMTIFCDEPPGSVFMGAVLGSPQHFLDMAELFVSFVPDELDYNHHAKMMHQDDLSMLMRMFDTKTRPKPEWLVKRPGCALFDYQSWRSSKLVHFGYAMKQLGYWPKHEWVRRLRPF